MGTLLMIPLWIITGCVASYMAEPDKDDKDED